MTTNKIGACPTFQYLQWLQTYKKEKARTAFISPPFPMRIKVRKYLKFTVRTESCILWLLFITKRMLYTYIFWQQEDNYVFSNTYFTWENNFKMEICNKWWRAAIVIVNKEERLCKYPSNKNVKVAFSQSGSHKPLWRVWIGSCFDVTALTNY